MRCLFETTYCVAQTRVKLATTSLSLPTAGVMGVSHYAQSLRRVGLFFFYNRIVENALSMDFSYYFCVTFHSLSALKKSKQKFLYVL